MTSEAAVRASGPASGTFDKVTECSTVRGDTGHKLFITLTGTLDGSSTTLTLQQEPFVPVSWVYPHPAPKPDLELKLMIDDAWGFSSYPPGNTPVGADGSIAIAETGGNTLHGRFHARYRVTDATRRRSLSVTGKFTCTETK